MADLNTIIRINQDELKRQMPVADAVSQSLGELSSREAEVLTRRYGLNGKDPETLQQIGEAFGVTRERVRQIENQGIKKVRAQLGKSPLSDLASLLTTMIRDHGGAVASDILLQDFLPESQRDARGRHSLSFFMEQLPEVTLAHSEKDLADFYARSQAHLQAVEQVAPVLAGILEKAGKPQTIAELLAAVKESEAVAGVTYLLDESFVGAVLEIGKKFVDTREDKWGLATWSDINPRNIREKTLYIMKEAGQPMHFKDLTDRISAAHFDNKRVTVQAVHNELINGDEFVLIGRGIYALKEWGYIPGTVAEVIKAVLAKAGSALDREEIITEVLKQRHVSRNTIIINLQEKSVFTRVDKHSYTLAESTAQASA